MMKLMKVLLLLVVMALTVCEPRRIRNWLQSCSVIRGARCNEDTECSCLMSRTSPSLICSYRNRCEDKSPLDEIWRKLPCPLIYKSLCTEDADCPCSEAPLICEDRECVKAKPIRRRLPGTTPLPPH
ncbi:uncharacterized protein LOC111339946 [Stylophora pistillata]|nr:uncharacterized protein LOC111339946 [Stylophora pistillata]